MKKLALLLLLCLFSCTKEYDGQTKIVIKGKIVNSNNNPVTNKEVKFYGPIFNQESVVIFTPEYLATTVVGQAITNSNGEYVIVVPDPANNYSDIIIETNADNNSLNKKQFRNIMRENFKNYELNLPVSVLYQKAELAQLSIMLNKVNTNNELKKIDFIGVLVSEVEDINVKESEVGFNLFDLERIVKKNQTIVLRYTVLDKVANTTSIAEQNIEIGNLDNVKYTLNY
jgi:hypothetical protein